MSLNISGVVPSLPYPNSITYADSGSFSPKNFQQEAVDDAEANAFKLPCGDQNNPVLASFLVDDSQLASQSNHSILSKIKKNPKKRAAPEELKAARHIKVSKRQSMPNDTVLQAAASALKVCSTCNSTKNVRYKKKGTKEDLCNKCYQQAIAAVRKATAAKSKNKNIEMPPNINPFSADSFLA